MVEAFATRRRNHLPFYDETHLTWIEGLRYALACCSCANMRAFTPSVPGLSTPVAPLWSRELDAAGMLGQKGDSGVSARWRGHSDAAFWQPLRHFRYKSTWYRATVVEADWWLASWKMCHRCGHLLKISLAKTWTEGLPRRPGPGRYCGG